MTAPAPLPRCPGRVDAPVDAPVDAAVDVGFDVAVDVAADVRSDVGVDVPVDRGVDTGPDVPACGAGLSSCGGACVDLGSSLAHCGSCDRACAAPLHGVASCAAGACGFTCEATYLRSGDACVRIEPPRLVAPLTSALVTSRRPRLRWSLSAGTDGAVVELCADRACATVLGSYEVTGSSTNPTVDLPPGVVFWRARGRVGSAAGTIHSPVWSFFVGARSAPVDTSWGTALDPDGDGRSDLAVGVPSREMSTGRVLIYPSTGAGYAATPSVTLDGRDGINAVYGHAVASAGDVNGDGYVDLAVGAYRASSGIGRVYLYAGSAGGLGSTPASTLSGRDGADGAFGVAVAGVGDVNGDGYGDVVSGASTVSRLTGRAYAYLGSATGLSTTPATAWTGPDGAGGLFGNAVAGAGDVNGDGYADVLVAAASALTATGRVYLYLGSATGLSTAAATVLTGPDGTLSNFGVSIGSAGDVNGDGYADVVVGADRVGSFAGRVYLYLGGASGLSTTASATLMGAAGTDGNLGASVAGVGDLNRDGYADLAAYSYHATLGGRVRVYPGSAAGLVTASPTLIVGPDGAMSVFGTTLRGAGDVNGDGIADMVVTASQAASRAGRVYLFPGSASGVMATPSSTISSPEAANSGFGTTLAGASGR
nr:FG-GAP repeat protein [Deltaproteobacteria bacterium]